MTSSVDCILLARWIIPVVPSGQVLEQHALALSGDTLAAIVPHDQALQRYPNAKRIELPNHLLIPGLINLHGHAAMTLLRGYADDMALPGWLEQCIWPAEKNWVDEIFVRDGTRIACAEMIRTGTSTFADMYFYPDQVGQVAAQSGMRAQLAFPVMNFPTAWARSAEEYLSRGLEVHDSFKGEDRIQVAFGPHAPYSLDDRMLEKVGVLAGELDAAIQIHLHETAGEVVDYRQRHGESPLHRLNSMGLIGPRTQCVHMTQIDDQDIIDLQQTHAHVVHCPESNLKIASGLCPVQRLLDAGINVGLGTDGAASNNDLNLIGEMRTAALLGKAVAERADACSAEQVLAMATINAARALGCEDRIGSLEVGKQADIAAFDLSNTPSLPLYKPLSWLIYCATGREVSHLWVAGRLLLDRGELTSLDAQEIHRSAEIWSHKIGRDLA